MIENYIKILEECAQVATDRQASYGPAEDSIKDVTDICFTTFGLKLTPAETCKVIISLKLARNKNKWQSDTTLDLVNYVAILHLLETNAREPN